MVALLFINFLFSNTQAALLPYGDEVGDYRLQRRLDGCGPKIRSPIDIPIYGQMHNNMIVSNTFRTVLIDGLCSYVLQNKSNISLPRIASYNDNIPLSHIVTF